MANTRPLLAAVARRPGLWPEAVRAAFATAPRRWWSRSPFLPVPDGPYLAWRAATAYGAADATPPPDDLVAYLRWRRRQRRG